jgi:hypothetical protein
MYPQRMGRIGQAASGERAGTQQVAELIVYIRVWHRQKWQRR